METRYPTDFLSVCRDIRRWFWKFRRSLGRLGIRVEVRERGI